MEWCYWNNMMQGYKNKVAHNYNMPDSERWNRQCLREGFWFWSFVIAGISHNSTGFVQNTVSDGIITMETFLKQTDNYCGINNGKLGTTEPRHDKTNKMSVCPAKTLILVFAGRTLILLVLSCRGSVIILTLFRPFYFLLYIHLAVTSKVLLHSK